MSRVLFAATWLVWFAGEAALTRRDRARATGAETVEHGQTRLAALSWAGLGAGAAAGRVRVLALPGGRAGHFCAGATLMWAGMLIRLAAVRALGPLFRREVVIQRGHDLVERGPYRIVRHPGYAGTLLVMAGIGVAEGSVPSVALCVGAATATHIPRIRVEESALRERFPSYDAKAPRWRLVPGAW